MNSSYIDNLFLKNKVRLAQVYDAYSRTPYGKGRPVDDFVLNSYADFQTIPLLSSSVLSNSSDNISLDITNCSRFYTSGSTDKSKLIYIPNPVMAAPLPQRFRQLVSSTKCTFVSGSLDTLSIHDSFMQGHLNVYTNTYPSAIFSSFSDEISVSKILRESETIVFFSYPAAFTRFLYLTESAINKNMISNTGILTRNFYAKLTGEPVSTDTAANWLKRAQKAFGFLPQISLRYGATEVQEIGHCDLGEGQPIIEYETTDRNCFIEILDPKTLAPIENGTGLIVVTSFRTSGSILLRYKLGDMVRSRIVLGKRILDSIQRENFLNIAGNSLSVQYLINQVNKAFECNFRFKINRRIDETSGIETVTISIYTIDDLYQTPSSEIESYVERMLVSTLPIASKLKDGMVVLIVQVKNIQQHEWGYRKIWKLENDL